MKRIAIYEIDAVEIKNVVGDRKIVNVIAIDPGASAGVCTVVVDDGSVRIRTFQGPVYDASVMIRDQGSKSGFDIIAFESPYTQTRAQMPVDGKRSFAQPTPRNIWQMGRVAGHAEALALRHAARRHAVWTPAPTTWRSILGLNVAPNGSRKREDVNDAVHAWAEANSKIVMRTSSGGPAYDEANAYALARATLLLVQSLASL